MLTELLSNSLDLNCYTLVDQNISIVLIINRFEQFYGLEFETIYVKFNLFTQE